MNKPIRYHSDSQQNRLYYNYPIQQYSQPINLNRNRFQQEDQIDYIQNDFQNYDRKINQDHQQVEQNRTNLENNSKDQEISRNFANNNDNNDNDSYSLNSEEIEQFEQNKKFCMATDLCTVIELVLAIILLNMFYYIKGLQKYLINEVTFQPNETSKLIVTVASAFYIFCYYFTIDGNNQSQGCKITAIVVLTFIFQYLMLLYCIFLFKTLNQGFIQIQIFLCYIILILLVFIARPRYNINIRKSLSIIIVSTLSLELFMSIIFQDKYFWWVFGVPVMIYLLLIRMFGYFWIRYLVCHNLWGFLHYSIFIIMFVVFLFFVQILVHLT